MEAIFEALLQFLFEFIFEVVGEVIGEILSELPTFLNHIAFRFGFPFEISLFDEITKLNLFD